MANDYIWGLEPWQQGLAWLGGVLVYICLGGFAWALTPESWNSYNNQPGKHFASIFWPVTLVCYFVYRIATFGPRLIKAFRDRNRLPKAEIRR